MSRKTIMPNIAYDTQRRTYYVTMRARPRGGGAPERAVAISLEIEGVSFVFCTFCGG